MYVTALYHTLHTGQIFFASWSYWLQNGRKCCGCASRKTCLYNFDPLKPHFYIVKWGFTEVYFIFLISAQNIDCGYSLELPREAVLTCTHNLCFEQKYEEYQNCLSENFHYLMAKFPVYLNRHVFVMGCKKLPFHWRWVYIAQSNLYYVSK